MTKKLPHHRRLYARLDRQPRHELVLHGRAELPVVGTHAPAAENVRVDRRRVRIGVAEVQAHAAHGRAQVAAGGEIVLQRRAQQVAVDGEIPVPVGPAARGRRPGPDARDDAGRRIVRAVDDVAGGGLEIFAAVDLQRRLAVAEEVVGDAEPRRDVVVAADAHGALERNRLRVEARGFRRAVALRRRPAPGAVVADAALQRQAADRPLVLGIQPDRLRAIVLVPARRQEVRDRHRAQTGRAAGRTRGVHGGVRIEGVAQLRVVGHASVVHFDERAAVSDLDVVRPGDVGHRCAPARVQRVVVVEAEVERIEDAAIREVRPPVDAALLGDRDEIHQSVGRRHAEPGVPVGESRVASLDQRAAVERRGIGGLRRVVGKVVVAREGFGRHRVGAERAARRHPVVARLAAAVAPLAKRRSATAALIVVRDRHAVPGRELRGETQA